MNTQSIKQPPDGPISSIIASDKKLAKMGTNKKDKNWIELAKIS
jgi:hypothetical protein